MSLMTLPVSTRLFRAPAAVLLSVLLSPPVLAACGRDAEQPFAPIDWSAYGKLTLPVDADGHRGPDEIAPARLAAGYASDWFRTLKAGDTTAGGYRAAGGETLFRTPVGGGAATVNAKYLRSELREQVEPGNDRRNWGTAGEHRMTGTVRITELPTPTTADGVAKTVIAQIHGVDAAPPVKLQVARKGIDDRTLTVYGIYNPRPKAGDPERSTGLSVPPCAPIAYEILVRDGVLTTTVNGIVLDRRSLLPAWADTGLYFKAGNYVQNQPDNAAGSAEVIVEAFAITHR